MKTTLLLLVTLIALTTTAQRTTLYKHCANDLAFTDLGIRPNPKSLKITGAIRIEDRCTPTTLSLEPTVPRVELRATSAHSGKDTTIVFRVRNAPAPRYTLLYKGQPVSQDNMPAPGETIRFELQPDPAFAATHPDDASFEFEGMETWVNFALSVPQRVSVSKEASNTLELKASENMLQRGYLTLTQLTRINYKGERLKVNVPKNDLTFRLQDALTEQ